MKNHDPGLARVFSALIPGLGQLYNGDYNAAALFFACHIGMLIWAGYLINGFIPSIIARLTNSPSSLYMYSITAPSAPDGSLFYIWGLLYLSLWFGNIAMANTDAKRLVEKYQKPGKEPVCITDPVEPQKGSIAQK